MLKYTFILFTLLYPALNFSQQLNLPLNRENNLVLEKNLNAQGVEFHTGFKPYLESKVNSIINYDSLNTYPPLEGPGGGNKLMVKNKKSWFYRKLFRESFIIIDSSDVHITIDPLFNYEYGKDLAYTTNNNFYKNTRGMMVRGDIGKTFSFESSFNENQATFVNYLDDFVKTNQVVPGQGRPKIFKKNGYDFSMATGYVSYTPNKHFNFQAGHGKHFSGDGYRSLLLSDNAFNYPYLRITSTFGQFQYTNLYASFMNLKDDGLMTPVFTERLFEKKAASFQFLSWNANKKIQLGLFQGLIWQASNSINQQNLNLFYFNPIILSNLAKYSLNNTNNILLGLTSKVKIAKNINLYAQFMLDDIAIKGVHGFSNKNGYQLGIKSFDLFQIKNLCFQLEYNQIRPYSYAQSMPEQSYTHYNQALAHPLGANFKELIVFLNYRYKNFFTELKFNYALIGGDSVGKNYGNNIFNSDNTAIYGINSSNILQGQGVKTSLSYQSFQIAYLFNANTNFNVIAGITNRIKAYSSTREVSNYFYVGIRTSLSNVYTDF